MIMHDGYIKVGIFLWFLILFFCSYTQDSTALCSCLNLRRFMHFI